MAGGAATVLTRWPPGRGRRGPGRARWRTRTEERTPAPGVAASLPCIYEVSIAHRRSSPAAHAFRHRSYMWCFELDSPPRLAFPLGALARFDRRDHLDVRRVLGESGIEPERIVVLANLKVAGYVFNPISVYWCYGPGGVLEAHVLEVHNTYGGRHAYVLPAAAGAGTCEVRKEMYVSPFNPPGGDYRVRVSEPAATVSVSVLLDRPGSPPFLAAMSGRRRDGSAGVLATCALRWPVAPLRGRLLIQWQGIRLWAKGMEVQPR